MVDVCTRKEGGNLIRPMAGGRAILCGILFLGLGALVVFSVSAFRTITRQTVYGFTFSSMYAESLGLEARETLSASLHAFHPDFVRLPLYWDAIERSPNVYSWEAVDTFVADIQATDAQVYMAIGTKVPRWPECFVPDWVNSRDKDIYRETLLVYMNEVVTRYAPVVDVWQVENEPFFAFGDCPQPDIELLKEEIALVRTIDPSAQVQMTVSGEQQMWGSVASLADRIGVSMYRKASHLLFGSFTFPVPASWYMLMRAPLFFSHTIVVSELQMEPWFTSHPRDLSPQVASLLFTSQDALNNLAYVHATGFSEVSFWGVEWWYYLRQQGYPELWDTMKEVMK